MNFIWECPFRLQIVVKSIKKTQVFLDSTDDSTGKY